MNRPKYISMLSYIVLLGAIYGELLYPSSSFMWIIFAFIGGVLLVIKNKTISVGKFKPLIILLDMCVPLFLILTNFSLHISIEWKQLFFLVISTFYIIFYFILLYKYNQE